MFKPYQQGAQHHRTTQPPAFYDRASLLQVINMYIISFKAAGMPVDAVHFQLIHFLQQFYQQVHINDIGNISILLLV